jgi:hypothetical protein
LQKSGTSYIIDPALPSSYLTSSALRAVPASMGCSDLRDQFSSDLDGTQYVSALDVRDTITRGSSGPAVPIQELQTSRREAALHPVSYRKSMLQETAVEEAQPWLVS